MDKKVLLKKLEDWKKLYKAAESDMETSRNRFYQIAGQKTMLEALLMEATEIEAKERAGEDESLPVPEAE